MAIVLELQEEALKSNTDILSLLRKSSLIARKLDLKDFQDWINNELNGYKKSSVPDYREICGELKAWNPYQGWIPVVAPNNEMERMFNTRKIPDSIPSLNSLLLEVDSQLSINVPAEMATYFNRFTAFETVYKIMVPKNAISNVVEQVKNKILDWAITLEENGILGEGLRFTTEEKAIAKSEPQIVNYISNFYGSVADSQIQQGTTNSKQNVKKKSS
jgi:hypothetical protein